MLNKIEIIVHDMLMKYPFIRRIIKRVYQLGMYTISSKIKSEGNLKRITPINDGYEYFFGYYDKSPWDKTDRYMLAIRVKKSYKSVAPNEKGEICLIDTRENNSIRVLGETNAWNVQQGCMLQWLGPGFSEKIIFNDFENDQFISKILEIKSGKEYIIDKPVYSVAQDGSFAITLDFSRLHSLRPGYGYSNIEDRTEKLNCPDETCLWKIDLQSGETKSLLKYTDFANFEPRDEMMGAKHKVNHIMINPSGTRFMVLHRWYLNNIKYSRLITCDVDGENMYNLSDDNFVSHCNWKSDEEIISFLNKDGFGHGYYLLKDESDRWESVWKELSLDGHPSYSPTKNYAVTDTYPNRQRLSFVYLIEEKNIKILAKVFNPFKYDNDVRCDLHPKWNREGDMVSIDSVFEGKRGLYVIDLKKGDQDEKL